MVRNEKISRNPDDYIVIDSIVVDSEYFWKPDLILGNPVEEIVDFKENLSPRSYILSFVEIGMLVPEKTFERFLPYMGVAAILFM